MVASLGMRKGFTSCVFFSVILVDLAMISPAAAQQAETALITPAMLSAIAAAITAAVAVVTVYLTWRKPRGEKALEEFKGEQHKRQSQEDADTARKSEIRKRLYIECEPLFFRLVEASDAALQQCAKLAKPETCLRLRPVNVNEDRGGPWMLNCSSETIATTYAIFLPLALFSLIRRTLTETDFSLDEKVALRYVLARELYGAFQNGKALADCSPALPYDPLIDDWRLLRMKNPQQYWWQDLTQLRLDRAIEVFVIREERGDRLLTFGEFEDLYRTVYAGGDRHKQKMLGVAANALYGFTPFGRPVFWRVLMAKVHLYHALTRRVTNGALASLKSESEVRKFLELDDYRPYEWSRHDWSAHAPSAAAADDAGRVALDYLVPRIHQAVRSRLGSSTP
jgi:hypothetical protein